MIHYDAYLELRRLAGAEGVFELESHRRRRGAMGRERAEIRGAVGVEVGPMVLRVGVSVPCHPTVKYTDEWRRDLMSASAVSKYIQKLTGGVGAVLLRFSVPTTARS